MSNAVVERVHAEMLQKFVRDATVAVQSAYYEGYSAGKEDGWDVGYEAGYDDGFFDRKADKAHDAEDEVRHGLR